MLNHLSLRKIKRSLRHHWLIALCLAALAGVLWIGAPAWAAPVLRPHNQTVPDPTATPESGPVATATPQPGDDDDDSDNDSDNNNSNDNTGSTNPNDPNITFPTGPGGAPGGAAPNTTANVTVDGLNMREGPNTTFNTLGTLPANTKVTVLSRSEDGAWWYICCLPGTQTAGWVSAQLLAPDFDVAQANTLVPVFGTTPTTTAATATPPPADSTQPQAELPLEVGFMIEPYFVWQGITATLTITVNNPNNVDALNVVLSDELPAALSLVEATADASGVVETVNTTNGLPLLLFRWANVPADSAVTAKIVVLVSTTLANGEVIDNLVATRASNVAYSASAVTIGMPPVLPPDFQ